MNRAARADRHNDRSAASLSRCLALVLPVLIIAAGCTEPTVTRAPPPNVGGRVAATTAGVAVGQLIPFGGTIVGIVSEAVSASTAESRENAGRAFERHKLKAVELAPAGKR